MKPDDELRIRDRLDTITTLALEQINQEHALRVDIRHISGGMSDDERIKFLHILTSYAYDKLQMSSALPEFAQVSMRKTEDYFAHHIQITDWQARRSMLQEAWFELEDEMEDLMDVKPSLVGDDDDDEE